MIRKSLLLLLAVALALLLAAPAWANGTVLKPVGPAEVTVGEEFTVGIVVYDVEGLMGVQFDLEFNPGVLEALSVESGDVFDTPFEVPSVITAVYVRYGAIVLSQAEAFSGTGTAALVTFKAKAEGTSELRLEDTSLGAYAGAKINHSTPDPPPTVTVTAPDTTPPTVTSTDPADGATGIPVDKTVTVTFTENIRQAARYDDISVEDADGNAVTFTKGISGKVLTIDPTGDLDYATAYRVNIPAGAVEDTAGNDLADDYAFDFTTEILPAPEPVITFTNMEGHWVEDCVAELVYRGILSGYPDGTFRPDQPITRLEAVCILARALELAPGTAADLGKFKDAAAIPAWAVADAAAAAREGLIEGYPHADGSLTFEPAKLITRTEMAAIMSRVLEKELGQITPAPLLFTDADDIPDWAKEAVGIALAKGVVGGYPDGTFRPQNNVTRAETASMVCRLLEAIGRM